MASETHTPPNGELWTTLKVSELESLRAALAEAERDRDEWRDSSLLAERQRDDYAGQCSALRSELARKDAALREMTPLVADALTGAIHGWTEAQSLDFQRRCRAALASPTAKGTT